MPPEEWDEMELGKGLSLLPELPEVILCLLFLCDCSGRRID